jgi:thiosulfate dehydrogenase [quinone] large subunit
MVDIANERNNTVSGIARATTGQPLQAPQTARRQLAGRTAPATVDFPADDRGPGTASATPPGSRSATAARYLLAGLRLALGWIFLWAFLDKLFGLGRATPSARAWIDGGSPTNGFLGSAKGPFSGFYHAIASSSGADLLFMGALLAIGVALLLGIGMRLAAVGGATLTVMMWTAVLPPTTNPFMDDHLIYAAVLIVLALLGAGNTLGLGRTWSALPLVRRAPWLQ